ncbi:hypothetical protein CsSME_00043351 [Camellia sinensis var. sinensis]
MGFREAFLPSHLGLLLWFSYNATTTIVGQWIECFERRSTEWKTQYLLGGELTLVKSTSSSLLPTFCLYIYNISSFLWDLKNPKDKVLRSSSSISSCELGDGLHSEGKSWLVYLTFSKL